MGVVRSIAVLTVAAAALVSCGDDTGDDDAAESPPASEQSDADPADTTRAQDSATSVSSAGTSPQSDSDGQSITVLYSRNAEQLPIFVADDQGIFADHGLDVTLEEAAGAGQISGAIIGGTGDMGLATATDLLLAADQGLGLVFATGTSVNTPENPRLLVYSSVDSGITDIDGLPGSRVGVPSRGSFAEIGVAILLDRAGLDSGSVQWVELPFPQMNDALNEGVIDAAVVVPPFTGQMQQAGQVEVLDLSELGDSVIIAVLSARSEWAADNPEAVRAFRASLAEAISLIETDPELAKRVTAEYTGLPAEIVDNTPLGNYRAETTVDEVQLWIDLMQEQGLLENELQASDLIVPAN